MDFSEITRAPTQSQLLQDRWVITMTGGKHNGTFLEIGSSDGVYLNNTVLLERDFGWRGVCVEANPVSFAKLSQARNAKCFNRAVWKTSGDFVEFIPRGVLGAISEVAFQDKHAELRRQHVRESGTITVETITANDLLSQSQMPDEIDYFSLDIEGAELSVLLEFDLSKYRFALATIEHNGHEDREKIRKIMASNGYRVASAKWEDWYYHPEVFPSLNQGRDGFETFEKFARFVHSMER